MKLRMLLALALLVFIGCLAPKQPEFDPLHPVTGKVQRAGQTLAGGTLRFNPIPDKQEFITNGLVSEDGSFSLTTVRTTDSKGERRPGAPAGEYSVVYSPESKSQTEGYKPPITLPAKIVIEAKDNVLTLEIPPQ